MSLENIQLSQDWCGLWKSNAICAILNILCTFVQFGLSSTSVALGILFLKSTACSDNMFSLSRTTLPILSAVFSVVTNKLFCLLLSFTILGVFFGDGSKQPSSAFCCI